MSQRNIHKNTVAGPKPRHKAKLQQYQYIPGSNGAGAIHCSAPIEAKIGFELLWPSGIGMEFSCGDKQRAIMLHECFKHMPEYENIKVTSANDAVAHVFRQQGKLMHFLSHGFSEQIEQYGDQKIPANYNLEIIYEEFDAAGDGRWRDYKHMISSTRHDKVLRSAVFMCMHIVIRHFGFSLFDREGSNGILPISQWREWETESAEGNVSDRLHATKKEIKQQVKERDKYIMKIEKCYDTYCKKAINIQKEIFDTEVDETIIEAAIKRYSNINGITYDVSHWMSHILMLLRRNFSLWHYTPNLYERDEDSHDDDQRMDFLSVFGFIYDGDSVYTQSMLENWNEYANNNGVKPITNCMVINNKKGIIKRPYNDPVLPWIYKIFDFNFQTMSYETK